MGELQIYKYIIVNPVSAFGHKFSFIAHWEMAFFACLIYPWQSAADMSRHPAFITSRRHLITRTVVHESIPLWGFPLLDADVV